MKINVYKQQVYTNSFYHNVGNEKHKSFITIREFDRQMKFLKDRGCNTSSCDSLDSQSGNISITFDDGYEDNLINAFDLVLNVLRGDLDEKK